LTLAKWDESSSDRHCHLLLPPLDLIGRRKVAPNMCSFINTSYRLLRPTDSGAGQKDLEDLSLHETVL
jgi:hypothetical protein